MPIISDKYRGSKEYLLVTSELIRAAQYSGVTTYQDIARLMGLPLSGSHMGKEVGHILGEISEDEHNSGRPMLSSIAVSVDGKPGPGFYVAARLLKRLRSESKADEKSFWESERKSVYSTWERKS